METSSAADVSNNNLNDNDLHPPIEDSELIAAVDISDSDAAAANDLEPKDGKKVSFDGAPAIDLGPRLFCSTNGRSHGPLVEFDVDMCPVCFEDLRTKSKQSSDRYRGSRYEDSYGMDLDRDALGDRNHDEDGVKITDNSDEKKPEKFYGPYTRQFVEIRDREGGYVTSKEWTKGPWKLTKLESKKKLTGDETILEALYLVHGNFKSLDLGYSEKKYEDLIANEKYSFGYFGTSLKINSTAILNAINKVVPYIERMPTTVPYTLPEPYAVVGSHLEALRKFAASPQSGTDNLSATTQEAEKCTEDESRHLEVLFRYLDAIEYGQKLEEERERNKRGLCTFRMLWTILRPGTTVFMVSNGIISAYVIESIKTTSNYPDHKTAGVLGTTAIERLHYSIELWNLKYDGKFVGRSFQNITIAHFDGEKPVSSLRIIPIDLYKEEEQGRTKKNLENWGRLWYKSLRGQLVYYKGQEVQPEGQGRQIEGRAYIDPNGRGDDSEARAEAEAQAKKAAVDPYYGDYGYDRYGDRYDPYDRYGSRRGDFPNCNCERCLTKRSHPVPGFPWKDYEVIDPRKVDSLDLDEDGDHGQETQHRYLVCDRVISGLMLISRNWHKLDIANCTPAEFDPHGLRNLVMPEKRKQMIMALVAKFKGSDSHKQKQIGWKADFVEGKGEGTIFLLHGNPGVGKTFTAECIAEYTGRPLISLTCADIGTDENQVEQRLNSWLNNAEKWGAVLLIDEADVFLERRQATNLKRNSLVSIFLRCLEYYRGILFLTTNRVGTFDDAFMSRIHIVIRYEALGPDERKQIWQQFINKLGAERPDFMITPSALYSMVGDDKMALCNQEWNGREIRNAFQTAIALADYRAQDKGTPPRLEPDDLQQVNQMTQDFKDYLTKVHGRNEEKRAGALRTR